MTYASRLVAAILIAGLVPRAPAISWAQTEKSPPHAAAFHALDKDHDGVLSADEFAAIGRRDAATLRRDFQVFDFDGDRRLSLAEFSALPWLGSEAERGEVPDPVVLLATARKNELAGHWPEWDRNHDGLLSANEFSSAAVARTIPGLETTTFGDWDLDQDGKLSPDEAGRLLDFAHGVRLPSGERLRLLTGRVVDWSLFRTLDADGDGRVSRDDYHRAMRHVENWESWYRSIDRNGQGWFDFARFGGSNHRTDPVATFLGLDADLNGRLTPEEFAPLPVDQRTAARHLFPGFDDNGDGALSLGEFQMTPLYSVDVLAAWRFANDANHDGRLSRQEFRFLPPPALAALGAEYFRRLDVDRDGFLSLDEWPFSTNHPEQKFRSLDVNGDRLLTEDEFAAEGSLAPQRLRRDFKLFDADEDRRLSLTEFLTLPYWVPEEQRGPIYDPVMLLAENSWRELDQLWPVWDRNGDGALVADEFLAVAPGGRVPGLEHSSFHAWDLDGDRRLSRDEARLFVDLAFGIRLPNGNRLRQHTGRVVDWTLFQRLDPDNDGIVSRNDYFRGMRGVENLEGWYRSIDKNNDGRFDYAEFAISNHRTDAIGTFLNLDVNLDGRLTPDELTALPADQPELAKFLIPAFDVDGDQGLSLREFQMSPIPTLHVLASWQTAQDANQDGRLSREEFHFASWPVGMALAAEYFRRLDLNEDGFLTPDEWLFVTNNRPVGLRFLQGAVGNGLPARNTPIWYAQFNNVLIVFDEEAAPLAEAEADDDFETTPRGRSSPQTTIAKGTAEEFVYGQSRGARGARNDLDVQLQHKVDAVDRACRLDPAQRRQLLLAGRGDIQRFVERAEKLKARLDPPGKHSNADEFSRWINPIAQDAQELRSFRHSNIFGADSLFAKTLPRALTPDQLAQYSRRRALPVAPAPRTEDQAKRSRAED